MNIIYKHVESAKQPASFETRGDFVYLRSNIVENKFMHDDNEEYTFWTYQEAKLTKEEFDLYFQELTVANTLNGGSNTVNIAKLVTGQEDGDNKQLIIMEAIADLYDAIANNL